MVRQASIYDGAGNSWCREGESNPQGTKYRRILSPLRLPVPPSRQGDRQLQVSISQLSGGGSGSA